MSTTDTDAILLPYYNLHNHGRYNIYLAWLPSRHCWAEIFLHWSHLGVSDDSDFPVVMKCIPF